MRPTCLLQGETLLPHNKRNIQVFYQTPPNAKCLAVVSSGLGRTNDLKRLPKWLDYLSDSKAYGVLLYNYPGLGKTSACSPECPQAEMMVLDLEYIINVARAEGWSDDQIYLVGISLGTGPTLQILKDGRHKYRGVMLFSPYASPRDITGIDRELQDFFGCTKNRIRGLESSDAMKEVAKQETPQDITIVVGMTDTTISSEHGADLSAILKDTPHNSRLIRINGAPHAAVRTIAKDHVRPILREPSSVAAGEERHDFRQTPSGLLLSGVFWIHATFRYLTASLRK